MVKVCGQVHKPIVRQQIDCMLRLAHSERRLQREEPESGVIKIIGLVDRQRLQQRTVPGGQPMEFMERISLGSV